MALILIIAFDFFPSAFESVGIVTEEEPGEEVPAVDGGEMRISELQGYGLGRGVAGGGRVVMERYC